MAREVKHSELAQLRKLYAAKQKYKCPVCGDPLVHGKITALDHCHFTGHIRGLLCGSCNRMEGKVRAAMRYLTPKTHMGWTDEVEWLRRLADYLERTGANKSGLIHPTFDIKLGKQKPKRRRKKK